MHCMGAVQSQRGGIQDVKKMGFLMGWKAVMECGNLQ